MAIGHPAKNHINLNGLAIGESKKQAPISPPYIRNLFAHLLLTAAYVLAGKLGLMLALPIGYASPIFPAAGIAIAAALIGGRRTLPWIFLSSFLLNIWVGYSTNPQFNGTSFIVASTIAIASVTHAAIGGWGLRRVLGCQPTLAQGSEILHFMLLMPVICLTSAGLSVGGLWALGIVDATNFSVNFARWWIGDTLGVIVVFPLVMIVAGEPRGLWKSRTFTVALPMLLGLTLLVGIFLKINRWEQADSLIEFRQYSYQALNQVKAKLEEQDLLLEQTGALFTSDPHQQFSRNKFHHFLEHALIRFPMIQAVEWVPKVDAAQRAGFEKFQRDDLAGFSILESDTKGGLQRAGERDEYYPVTYVEPLAGNEPAVGFDLASNAVRRQAISKAIHTGISVISAPMKLVQERQEQAGVLMMLAVNSHNGQSGVVLSVLRMGNFMDKLLTDTRPSLYTRLIDLDERKTVYDNFAPGALYVAYEQVFEYGTRHYRLETAPTPAYIREHRGWQSWGILAVGGVGTGLMGSLLLLGTGYTFRMKQEVADRTKQLSESEERFRTLIENLHVGVLLQSPTATILLSNKRALELLGLSEDQLLGKSSFDPRWNVIHENGMPFPGPTHPVPVAIATGKAVHNVVMGVYRPYTQDRVWLFVNADPTINADGSLKQVICTFEDITERKRMEALVVQTQERLAEAQSVAKTGSWHVVLGLTEAQDVWSISKELRNIYGHADIEQISIDTGMVRMPPEDQERTRQIWEAVKRGEGPTEWEHRIIVDGKIKWIKVTARVDYNDQGQLIAVHGTNQDITANKLAENALRESEAQNQALISAIPDIILTNRRDGEYLAYHASDSGLLYKSAEDFLHRKIEDILPKHLADIYMKAISDALNTRTVQDVRYSMLVACGEEKYFEAKVAPCTEDTVISVIRDITERERERRSRELRLTAHLTDQLRMTEEELRESEQRLSLAADAAGLGIWIRDLVQGEIWTSIQWCTLFGFTPSVRLEMAQVLARVHAADRLSVSQIFAQSWQETDGYETSFRIELPDGQLRWIASLGRVERNVDGQPIRIRGVSFDITARKLAELEVEQKRVEVTYLSRVATLGELSGAMAHELNQPLATILINAQVAQRLLAKDSVDLNELREILQDIVDDDKRAGEVIWRLRQLFVKSETQRQNVDMNELMQEVSRLLHNDLINRGVVMDMDLASGKLVVHADRVQLQQVAINLVMNACDATDSLDIPHRVIVVRTAVSEGNNVQVSIIDQGSGLSAETIEKLFQAFHTTKERGMGLGLSICKNIVNANDGRLWGENNPDCGASFHFSFPLQKVEAA